MTRFKWLMLASAVIPVTLLSAAGVRAQTHHERMMLAQAQPTPDEAEQQRRRGPRPQQPPQQRPAPPAAQPRAPQPPAVQTPQRPQPPMQRQVQPPPAAPQQGQPQMQRRMPPPAPQQVQPAPHQTPPDLRRRMPPPPQQQGQPSEQRRIQPQQTQPMQRRTPPPTPQQGQPAPQQTPPDLQRRMPPPQAQPEPRRMPPSMPQQTQPTQRGLQPPAPQAAQPQRIEQVREQRREERRNGRTLIREGDRTIVREGERTFIQRNEGERFRRSAQGFRTERRGNETFNIAVRPNGAQIVTVTDANGRLVRRLRRDPGGREIVIIDNRPRVPRAGFFVTLPPPRLRIPRERYIVEAYDAPPALLYETLVAPPVEPLARAYSLDEIRYSVDVRDRMPRIDLDTVTFDSGSWEVTPDQVDRLEPIARAILRAIERDPAEVFLIEGHTDAVGSDIDNLSLSDRRAEAVAQVLTDTFGVPPENLTTQGYGEQYLKIATEEPERRNRRVTVRRITPLLSGDEMAGGPPPR